MSEFDKWFSKDGSIIPAVGDAGYEGYVERRKTWKAALALVLNTFEKNIDIQVDEDRVDVYKMVADELEE